MLAGTVGVELGGETFLARPGDLILKPRGVPHAFWNGGDEPASLLEVITPAGFEGYFERLGGLLAAGPEAAADALPSVAAEFGLEVDPDSVGRLVRAHGLRL